MTTRTEKLARLIETVGFDEALKLAPTLQDDGDSGSTPEARDAARAAAHDAEVKKVASSNPFVKGPHFSLREQGRLYANEKTRKLAIALAKSAGITLPENPTQRDLVARAY